jgi:hypothetical protein
MCPACLASAALIGGSAVSTGGLSALVVRMVCPKRHIHSEQSINPLERRNENGNHQPAHDESGNEGK